MIFFNRKNFSLFSIALLLTANSLVYAKENKITVFAVNYPLAYFAERIGGEFVDIYYPIPADIDPAFWEPTTEEILKIQKMDLILLNGADYAKWTKKVSLPYSKQVNTSKSFKENYIHVKEAVSHQHGPGGEHSHTGTAFTTWLDFSQAIAQAQTVSEALARKRPDNKDMFERNYSGLEQDLAAIDRSLTTLTKSFGEKPLFASHPVYQYLVRRYQLNIQSVLWEPDIVPDQEQWRLLQSMLNSHKAKWMIWEGEPAADTTARLQAIGISSVVFDPCVNKPNKGDFLSVMQSNLTNLKSIFQ
ncbi:metal ABC transporter substrate-binding protein [Kaarinaea lacus]